MKKIILVMAGFLLCSAVMAENARTNIIFLVGDGMGVGYTSAYRFYQSESAVPTIFDEMLVGMSSTYPDDKNQVTDSAAAATALATGIKTYNGAIGIDAQHKPVETILEKARALGYSTGIAVTSQVNHATPAAFLAHADSRLSYDKIADQYVDSRIDKKPKFDVLFGGGQEYFVRKDRNIVRELESLGFKYYSDFKDMPKIKKLPVVGLFEQGGLTPALESAYPLRLADMTEKALQLLPGKSGKPFFLMLEASQIDWCGHANDIACAMGEMRDMAMTMKVIKQFIDKNPNTIFVATADHSTGGFSMGAKGEYKWGAAVVRNIKATGPTIARRLLAAKANWKDEWQNLTQIKLADDEQKILDSLIIQSDETDGKLVAGQLTTQVLAIIDKYSSTGWTTKGHTGEDVQIFSYGKGSQEFAGAMDNTMIAKKLLSYLAAPAN